MIADRAVSPQDAAKILLQALPARRMRDVVERRFGLKGKSKVTLEKIGSTYRITRERVRQIERNAMRRFREEERQEIRPLLALVEGVIRDHGEVMAVHHLFSHLAPDRFHPHLQFILHTSPRFSYFLETDSFHPRWVCNRDAASDAEQTTLRVAERLKEIGHTIKEPALRDLFSAEARAAGKDTLSDKSVDAHLKSAKIIKQDPYGEYGLISWPAVCPRGIKDKAYAAALKVGRPMHFREVTDAIDRASWPGRKKAHPQTVHNELIKDRRFILVGRGMYALKEWGYEPGTVRDILISLLTRSSKPLAKDELVRLASERRMVKTQTILLNLQDRARFKRMEDGKYTLV